MQIKALRGAHGDYGSVRRGQIIDVVDAKAQQLIKRGIFVPVQGEGAAKPAAARPSQGPSGSQTGEAKPSSSSPAARAPAKRSTKASKKPSGKSAS